MQSPGISTCIKACWDISHSVSPALVTNNGKQLPIVVNVNVNFTLIPLIDLLSCTWYNTLVPCFIIGDFVARTIMAAPHTFLQIYTLFYHQLKQSTQEELGIQMYPMHQKHSWVTSLWVWAETLFLLEGQNHCLILEQNGYCRWELGCWLRHKGSSQQQILLLSSGSYSGKWKCCPDLTVMPDSSFMLF